MEESLWNDNMKIIAVTTYNNKLYKEYAHRFEKTYNWDFPYTVYNEDDGMLEAIPECQAFVERNKHRFEGKDFVKDYFLQCYSEDLRVVKDFYKFYFPWI